MGVDYFPKSMSSKVNETAHEEIELTYEDVFNPIR